MISETKYRRIAMDKWAESREETKQELKQQVQTLNIKMYTISRWITSLFTRKSRKGAG